MKELPARKPNRLRFYDYSQSGYYFVTICTYERQHLFGSIEEGKMQINDLGKIVDHTWNDLVNHNNIKIHEYVVMPDHIHGIIEICDPRRERSVTVPYASESDMTHYHGGLPEIVRQFKTFSSKRINEFLKNIDHERLEQIGYDAFPTMRKIWQKSYYEHIIRDEADYMTKVNYILNNPITWEMKQCLS